MNAQYIKEFIKNAKAWKADNDKAAGQQMWIVIPCYYISILLREQFDHCHVIKLSSWCDNMLLLALRGKSRINLID